MKHYTQKVTDTARIRIAYYRSGESNKKKLLFLHGNLSSSVFLLPLLPDLEKEYDVIIPDLRCFGDTETAPIDATRGYRDWSDDLYALMNVIGWKSFYLAGWSLGGNIAMQYATDHPKDVKKLILVCPGSPYGFGGTIDEKGTPLSPVGLGSGGGTANQALVTATGMGSRLILRDILHRFYFKPPFRMPREWENLFIEAISKIRIGNNYYPGNYHVFPKWPHVVSGDKGVLNAMSPLYANQSDFLNIRKKPPVLWIRGLDDMIVSDHSMMELGALGQAGIVPGWPGMKSYPPQPMVSQIRYFLNLYMDKGGSYTEICLPGGHMCALESTRNFLNAFTSFA